MKKITKNIILTIISIAAAIFIIYGIQITNNLFIKMILILTFVAYGFMFPYYIWKRN